MQTIGQMGLWEKCLGRG